MKRLLSLFLLFSAFEISAGDIIIKTNNTTSPEDLTAYLNQNYQNMLAETKVDYLIKNRKYFEKSRNNNLLSNSPSLLYIESMYKVSYSSQISEDILSAKLTSDKFFEYAEPLPKRELLFTPNDPLVQDQYYLENINMFDAWDNFTEGEEIVIAIVDTGIEYDHEDLAENIWTNPGETGTDENGVDKSSNGIDDDENGFIDDYIGWDFISSTSNNGEDNDPYPGSSHGTHVAGISAAITNNETGVAGIAPNTKLMAVKIGPDNPNIRSVARGYEAILYAAIAGADVINCSWGGGSFSNSENAIINAATELGAIVVAAAGNDNSDVAFFPSAYKNVISVASTGQSDTKSGFSNYHSTVDISAPGSSIMNTVTGNSYARLSGTSMASPVIAGVVAMALQTYPDYTPEMIKSQLQATSNPIGQAAFAGKLGSGLVDVNRMLTENDAKYLSLEYFFISDGDGNGIFESGDEIIIDYALKNVLNPINNVSLNFEPDDNVGGEFISASKEIGLFDVNFLFEDSQSILLPDSLPLDFTYDVTLKVTGEDFSSEFVLSFIVNQSYRNIITDNIQMTLNSRGNIAFNDYPGNSQGIGFSYKEMENILFEGGLIISTSSSSMSSVARSSNQSAQYSDFEAINVARVESFESSEIGYSSFTDNASIGRAGVEVSTEYIVPKNTNDGTMYIKHTLKNINDIPTDSLFIGHYYDWDIGESARENKAILSENGEFGYQYNTEDDDYPKIAVSLISDGDFIFTAIDNDGSSTINPGVYDGFTREEQYKAITGKVARTESNITDASMVMATGPYSIDPDEEIEVIFALMANLDEENFQDQLDRAKADYGNLNTPINFLEKFLLFPNPLRKGELNLNFEEMNFNEATIELIDLDGRIVFSKVINRNHKSISLDALGSGIFMVKLNTDGQIYQSKLIIEH